MRTKNKGFKSYSRLYKVRTGFICRCYAKTDKAYKYYGGRGITVCKEWLESFEAFKTWAYQNGYTEGKGLTLDRINTDGSYCPENCRFVTRKQQARNRRVVIYITYNGETHPIWEWADITGLAPMFIFDRYRRGLSPEDIFTGKKYKRFKPIRQPY